MYKYNRLMSSYNTRRRVKKQGWQWGRVGPKDGVFAPVLHGFVLPHSRPLGPCKISSHPIKLYFLLICPQLLQFFFNKTCFVNKNILEITNKLILSNQTNFQQKLNNIIKMFNKAISQQQKKSQNTKSMIQQYINLFIIKTKKKKC